MKDTVFSYSFLISLLIFVVSLILVISKKKISPILVIVISAALGIGAGYIGEMI